MGATYGLHAAKGARRVSYGTVQATAGASMDSAGALYNLTDEDYYTRVATKRLLESKSKEKFLDKDWDSIYNRVNSIATELREINKSISPAILTGEAKKYYRTAHEEQTEGSRSIVI